MKLYLSKLFKSDKLSKGKISVKLGNLEGYLHYKSIFYSKVALNV